MSDLNMLIGSCDNDVAVYYVIKDILSALQDIKYEMFVYNYSVHDRENHKFNIDSLEYYTRQIEKKINTIK